VVIIAAIVGIGLLLFLIKKRQSAAQPFDNLTTTFRLVPQTEKITSPEIQHL